jgi:genome maintenance exonuclease 1
MEWNNKYIYPKSTRSIVDGSRHYSVNEERLPSVTTILKATESEEKKASLQAWKQRVGQNRQKLSHVKQVAEEVQCMNTWKNFYLVS